MAITIHQFNHKEIKSANNLFIAAFNSPEGRKDDLRRLLSIQPDGWFMAMDEGVPAGMVGAVDYGIFAWIGMMAVHPSKQGQGIGRQLMSHVLEWLGSRGNCVAFLDATAMGEPLYRGFSFHEIDRVLTFIKNDDPTHKGSHLYSDDIFQPMKLPAGIRIMTEVDIPLVAGFDTPIFGSDRSVVLRVYLHDYPQRAFIASSPSGKITGYLLVQPRKLGPWVADSEDVAGCLLQAALLLDFPEGAPTVLVPAENKQAKSLLEENGFHVYDSLSHMQRGGTISPSRREFIYGQISYALG
ncbi:MAG: GNAT family N-acetyltransferase [Anaerolineales bacterium]|nr:GNAT family N-acetyltransferase [Anaerolineales bacterium]